MKKSDKKSQTSQKKKYKIWQTSVKKVTNLWKKVTESDKFMKNKSQKFKN